MQFRFEQGKNKMSELSKSGTDKKESHFIVLPEITHFKFLLP
ncbi:hypothetical protein LEP1GSC034_2877 [Leptospira interrogans str. 2003000735]|uniref:Uncharacterized protein n=2 Tax=Leptospira interrogans TaxID=173 RepID=A0A829D4F1_LEPIR|nr:hypothetical protein LEP1GSC025_1180 [Leptospira interrogans str. 2002000621]EKR18809.1 hypothetical protein LEP1GSC019_4293 [Leptospira interrogans serovar Pyrogenes str. 2006006960]EMJ67626.1 hypothetical protein LEP1GSC034_2877 [Leptospira interrogans str. 2003000735]EMJ73037.1 hypothetical protein LEP1GSC033_4776 [Leptospira interrogans str. 2002000632]EMY03960.1 hypothetical protein LEP1GSC029_3577 [Leptospira interrogans str. 2002000626]EMY24900.1 hypothetical protein LEP1GSC115_1051 